MSVEGNLMIMVGLSVTWRTDYLMAHQLGSAYNSEAAGITVRFHKSSVRGLFISHVSGTPAMSIVVPIPA